MIPRLFENLSVSPELFLPVRPKAAFLFVMFITKGEEHPLLMRKGLNKKNKATGEVEAYIVYTSFSAILSPEEFLFVAEHECAHQRLGHTEGVSLSNLLTDIKSREYDADCEAARELKRKFSYNGEQLKRAMKTVISMPESNTHPGGRQRYEYALQCLLDARP